MRGRGVHRRSATRAVQGIHARDVDAGVTYRCLRPCVKNGDGRGRDCRQAAVRLSAPRLVEADQHGPKSQPSQGSRNGVAHSGVPLTQRPSLKYQPGGHFLGGTTTHVLLVPHSHPAAHRFGHSRVLPQPSVTSPHESPSEQARHAWPHVSEFGQHVSPAMHVLPGAQTDEPQHELPVGWQPHDRQVSAAPHAAPLQQVSGDTTHVLPHAVPKSAR